MCECQSPAGRLGTEPGHAVGELRDGQRVEQLYVPQSTATALQVGLCAVGDLAAAFPARPGLLDEAVETVADVGAPLPAHPADEQIGQLDVADDVTGLEHSQRRGDVRVRHLQGLRDGADAVVELDVRVPQRIPELVGHLRDDRRIHVVVKQKEVEIRIRQEFPATEPTDRDEREAAVGFDAQLGTLCGQPELVQVDERVTERGCVESTPVTCGIPCAGAGLGATGEQLPACAGQVRCLVRSA